MKEFHRFIDKDTVWLEDLGGWCIKNTNLLQKDLDEGNHPTLEQHQSYAKQVVLPSISKLM